MNPEEVWKPVIGYEGVYSVSNLGRVRRDAPACGASVGSIVKHWISTHRYATVALSYKSRVVHRSVHTLVLEAFVGPRPRNMGCRHLDGNRLNPRLDNLRWGTQTENEKDKVLHGTTTRGAHNGQARLSEEDVRQIQVMLKQGKVQQRIADHFGVGRGCVSKISTGRRWVHLVEK